MRIIIILAALAALFVAACSTPGRRTAANAAACADRVGEANAAAAAADGGQTAHNAPFSGETGWRADASSTVGSGAGSTSSSRDGNVEQRETASGGAQNVAVNVPTEAWARAGGSGGTSASVASAQRTVEMYTASLQLALSKGAAPEQIRFLSEELARAQQNLALAEAGTRMNVTVNYHQDHQTNTLFGVSSSSTDGRPNEQAVREAAEGMSALAEEAARTRAPAAREAPASPSPSGSEGGE